MEKHQYQCNYCKKEYIPKRRRVQKFCSNSCRVSSHQLKNKNSKTGLINKDNNLSKKMSVDEMSIAGVGNAAAGTLVVNAIKALLTREENKPATKGDLRSLFTKLEQFQEIVNMGKDIFGRKPFFDSKSKKVVYR
jgi:hypothetical protein